MGKGEIARYEQFLLFPQCFKKACFPGASKGVIVWEWVKHERFCTSGKRGQSEKMCSPFLDHTASKFLPKLFGKLMVWRYMYIYKKEIMFQTSDHYPKTNKNLGHDYKDHKHGANAIASGKRIS